MLVHHRHASKTTFKWRFAGGPMMARFKWYLDPLITLKKDGPPLKKLSGSAHATKGHTSLRICAVCSVPLLFAFCHKVIRFSCCIRMLNRILMLVNFGQGSRHWYHLFIFTLHRYCANTILSKRFGQNQNFSISLK